MSSLTVIYRRGGTENATWHSTTPVLSNGAAQHRCAELDRAGYKAMIFDTDRLNAVGLPTGWDPILPAPSYGETGDVELDEVAL